MVLVEFIIFRNSFPQLNTWPDQLSPEGKVVLGVMNNLTLFYPHNRKLIIVNSRLGICFKFARTFLESVQSDRSNFMYILDSNSAKLRKVIGQSDPITVCLWFHRSAVLRHSYRSWKPIKTLCPHKIVQSVRVC